MHCIPDAWKSVRSKYFSSTQDRLKLSENHKSKANCEVLPTGWCSNILQGEHTLELRSKNLVPWDLFLISQWIYWGAGGQLCYSVLRSSHTDAMIISLFSSHQILRQILRVDVNMSEATVLFVYYSHYQYTKWGLHTVLRYLYSINRQGVWASYKTRH